MRLLYRPLHKLSLSSSSVFMASNHLLKPTFFSNPLTPSSRRQLFHTFTHPFSAFPLKPNSRIQPFCLKTNGYSNVSQVNDPPTVFLENTDEATSLKIEILKSKLSNLGVDCDISIPGQFNHLLCPMCSGGDSGEKSLSLFIEPDGSAAVWTCFRAKCGWTGNTRPFANSKSSYQTSNKTTKIKIKREITVEGLQLEPPCDELVSYFAERMISKETLKRNAVMQRCYGDQIAIAFTYWREGALISCKYRDINKKFWQEADTEKIFYGLDDIKDINDIIIVEGEMDKLAMEEAGFRNCVSVPDGAPPSASTKDLPPEEMDTKYSYLWNCKEYLKKASRIILATDGDKPGQALAEELARRLGRERCWRVKWPKKTEDTYFKDANEVLMYMGPDVLKEVIENAELYPIRGLFKFSDYFDEIDAYYYGTAGYGFGASTGWKALNELYNVVPGELTIVTGVPNSGKSEWIDALLCNLNHNVGWKFALCSMENKVREHARKLLEKHIKKPFFTVRYGESAERMNAEEFEHGKEWLKDTFYLIRCEDDSLPNIKWVLDLAKAAVLRHGVRGLVIDPYNELDHQRPPNQTETEYVSQMLTKVKRFAQHHSCHVWFVAHPRQILVRKVRNKVAGTIGEACLSYDRVTGLYIDVNDPSQSL
ncbi:twinkle homolog protein, chloroplastic/mitochondrial isoform X3 [Humulus lupulus]|uniref:twinkle homolog protein, chloroplastic/mitochondrial isoform X3 n=1 Tax=Humulus lupulus TaxID=3486 RepID=UPI002B4121CC|nr:twinkle homolog protein, chloroplastic/mitochondrial isoform X3 [Humulus lupulus]